MEYLASITALIPLIGAGYLLTVRTWHQKHKIEDFVGAFDAKIDALLGEFALDQKEVLTPDLRVDKRSRRVLMLAGTGHSCLDADRYFWLKAAPQGLETTGSRRFGCG
jgi:hypothetical protein